MTGDRVFIHDLPRVRIRLFRKGKPGDRIPGFFSILHAGIAAYSEHVVRHPLVPLYWIKGQRAPRHAAADVPIQQSTVRTGASMRFRELQNPVFVIWAFVFQFVLIAHFIIRKVHFDFAVRYGWIVYVIGLIGILVSLQQIHSGKTWIFWIGGFLLSIWAVLGLSAEYLFHVAWRAPIVWGIFLPYVGLYLTSIMFYWWPLAEIGKKYWYGYGVLFVISTYLNATSHVP